MEKLTDEIKKQLNDRIKGHTCKKHKLPLTYWETMFPAMMYVCKKGCVVSEVSDK